MLFRRRPSPVVAQQIKLRQANHHHDTVRPHFFLIVQQRRQLIIKEQAVVKAGFGILGGVGANQGIHAAALIAGELQLREQHIQRAAGTGRPFMNRTAHLRPALAAENASRAQLQ